MNFLAAVLLLVLDEETAFWGLAKMVETLLPGQYSNDMALVLVDQGVLAEYLRHEDAELVAHLESLQTTASVVTTQWLLTCFVGSALPLGALLRVWDGFFACRHATFLFRLAAALLVTRRAQLLATADTAEAYRALSTLGADLTDAHAVDELLDAADSLQQRAWLCPRTLAAARLRHARQLARAAGRGGGVAAARARPARWPPAHAGRAGCGRQRPRR